MSEQKVDYVWDILRIALGWIFLWTFLDKLFGLGFNTASHQSWLDGVSPTAGFLEFGTKGPMSAFYQNLAGNSVVTWLYMLGFLGIGLALISGVFVKIAGYAGTLIMILIYTAGFLPPEHNPFLDEHIIYAIILISLTQIESRQRLGLGKWWSETTIVKRFDFLK